MKYIVGNWKMNLLSKGAIDLAVDISNFLKNGSIKNTVVICPPFTSLSLVANKIESTLLLGAQDCSPFPQGAYTGDVSGDMLYDLKCKYVILGHSERRQYHQETSELIKSKAEKIYKYNMIPIICLGESSHQRQEGKTLDVLSEQVFGALPYIDKEQDVIIAYEPVWAIGSGIKPQETEIENTAIFLREFIHDKFMFTKRVKILYGGSVNENNCYSIINLKNIDGLLIGGASLKAKSFIDIIKNCN